jgi:hypothetical protein
MSLGRQTFRRPGRLRPWLPGNLYDLNLTMKDVEALTYIVVDEIVGDSVGLSLSPWPSADSKGRLRFDIPDGPTEVGVNIEAFCRFLRRSGHRFASRPPKVDERVRRYLRVGDAFGARLSVAFPEVWTEPLDQWVDQPVYNMTREARLVAKLAYYGAVAGVWSPKEAGRFQLREGKEK